MRQTKPYTTADTSAQVDGKTGTVAGQYGTGGRGGGIGNGGPNFPLAGGAGGQPGGGGGGAAANTNAGSFTASGKGGDGWCTVTYYKLVV